MQHALHDSEILPTVADYIYTKARTLVPAIMFDLQLFASVQRSADRHLTTQSIR
jgi:hypothetical protein